MAGFTSRRYVLGFVGIWFGGEKNPGGSAAVRADAASQHSQGWAKYPRPGWPSSKIIGGAALQYKAEMGVNGCKYVLDIHRVAGNSRDMHESRQTRGQISTFHCYEGNN